MKKSISLRSLFAINIAFIIIILITMVSSLISIKSSEGYKNEIGDMLSETSYQMTDKLDYYMWQRYSEVSLLSKLDNFKDLNNQSKNRELFEQLKKDAPEYAWIGLLNPKGTVITATGGILEGQDISNRPVYQQALNQPFIGDVHEAVLLAKLLPNPTGEAMKFVDISRPVKDESGNLKSILAAHLSWEWAKEVEDSIMKPLKSRSNLDLIIVGTDNTVLLGPGNMIGKKLNLDSINRSTNGENKWVVETWQDGEKYLTGYASEKGYKNYNGLGWTILVRQPLSIAYAPVQKLINYIIAIGALCAIIFALVGFWTAGQISKPLRRITVAANKLRLGDKVEIPYYKGIKDIEILSVSLRSLINSLTNTENALGEMEEIAHHDQLTGMANRAALRMFIETLKKQAARNNKLYAVFYLDLDGFKAINDTYGHDAGDFILKEVAKRLSINVADEELAARMGGDEFVLIKNVPLDKYKEFSSNFANNLIKAIDEPYIIQGIKMSIGCSIGGSYFPLHSEDPIQVISLADKQLYESKRAGKNRYTCAEDF